MKKYKRIPFKSQPIVEGDILLRPDYKPGCYNYIQITSIENNLARFNIVELYSGHSRIISTNAGAFSLTELQQFKDSRCLKDHEEQEDINERVYNISKLISVDKLKGGNSGDEVKMLEKVLTSLAELFSNKSNQSIGLGTIKHSVSGNAIIVNTNGVHHGNYYQGQTAFLIQIQIGSGIDKQDKQVIELLAKNILSKYELKYDGYNRTRIDTTNGTNWNSVMLTAPSNP